jgi:hypothetical protein
MFTLNSERARALLKSPKFFIPAPIQGMRKFHSSSFDLFALVEKENGIVKNLSFSGKVPDPIHIYLEAMASLLIKKPISTLSELSLRECEAFLRDRNSVPALGPLELDDENILRDLFQWLKHIDPLRDSTPYSFSSSQVGFERLSLVDKVKELKAFLGSTQVEEIYQGLARPEVLDVEDLSVYVWAPYESEREKEAFEKLHSLGVETFGEDRLNFIPEP